MQESKESLLEAGASSYSAVERAEEAGGVKSDESDAAAPRSTSRRGCPMVALLAVAAIAGGTALRHAGGIHGAATLAFGFDDDITDDASPSADDHEIYKNDDIKSGKVDAFGFDDVNTDDASPAADDHEIYKNDDLKSGKVDAFGFDDVNTDDASPAADDFPYKNDDIKSGER